MKRFVTLVAAFAVAGCGGAPSPRRSSSDDRPDPAVSQKEQRVTELKAQKAQKEQDLVIVSQESADLDRDLQAEAAKPASKEKSERIAALNNLAREKSQAKDSLERDIKAIDEELVSLGAMAPPQEKRDAKHIDPDAEIAAMLEAGKEQQDAEKKMAATIAEEDRKKLEEANKEAEAKKAAMNSDAAAIAGAGAGANNPQNDLIFEERCAAILAKVKLELEKLRR